MTTYSQFAPTSYDSPGLGLDERQDWLVLGLTRPRDSGPFDESNFEAALQILGGESETCEVHRFGHWGPGWFEIILLHPSREAEGDTIESALEDYPLLDDEDFSNREYEEYTEGWANYGASEFRSALAKAFDLSWAAGEALDAANDDELMTFFESLIPSGEFYTGESNGVYIRIDSAIRGCTRGDIADFIRANRAGRYRSAA